MAEAGYDVILCVEVCHAETDKEKTITFPCRFKDEESWQDHLDDDFDMIKDDINEYLQRTGHGGWYVDGSVETERAVKRGETVVGPLVVP